MGIYVPIQKVAEDAHGASYRFTREVYESDPRRPGRLRLADTLAAICVLAKQDGSVVLVDDGGWAAGSAEFERVQVTLGRHWRAGELPDRTSWSS